jgi:hypothetical protein
VNGRFGHADITIIDMIGHVGGLSIENAITAVGSVVGSKMNRTARIWRI